MPSEDEGEGEELDPRVEGALQELNAATDDINVSEKELEVLVPLRFRVDLTSRAP